MIQRVNKCTIKQVECTYVYMGERGGVTGVRSTEESAREGLMERLKRAGTAMEEYPLPIEGTW